MDQQNWFYRHNNQQFGPVSRDDILHQISLGLLTAESYVWTEGMENWQPVGLTPELAAFLPAGVAQRPQSVTVFGILNIVFGGMSLMCSPVGIISILIPQPNSPFQLGGGMKLYTLVSYGIGMIMAVVLLTSGIGLLKLKNWARQTAFVYGWIAIGWSILGVIITGLLLSSNLRDVSQEALPAAIGGMVGGMCGGLIGLIYPVLLIIFMRKPHVIEACRK